MPPVPLSDAERYKEQAAKEPTREQFPAEKMPLWKKILGLVSAGAAGFGRHDNTTYDLTRQVLGAPEAAAEKKYGQAEDIWKRGLEAIQKESGLKNTESEMRKRDIESEQLEEGKKDPTDKKIDEYVNDQGQRVLTFQKADGTTYDKIGGNTFQKPEQDANKLAAEIEAQVGPKPTTAQFGGKTYPTAAAAQAAWGKAAEEIKNRETAAAGAARGEAFGSFRPVQVYNPETHNYEWQFAGQAIKAGAAPAGAAGQALGKQAQFAEMHTAVEKTRGAITNLDKDFTPEQIGKLTLAMRHGDDPTVFRNEIETLLGTQQLTPAQQDFVVWIGQLNERAMSLRNVAGMGQGSDQLRSAIQATLPSVKSGNKDMALKQLAAFENQVTLLERGVPGVKGSPMQGGGGAGKDLGAAPAGKAEGSTGKLPDGTKIIVRGGRIIAQ